MLYFAPSMETKKAYKAMLKDATPKLLGISSQSLSTARSVLSKGEYPSDKIMRRWLKNAGWRKVQDEQWDIARAPEWDRDIARAPEWDKDT